MKQMDFPTSDCIALPVPDRSLWVAVRHALLLQVMLHLRNVVSFPCGPRQRLLERAPRLLLRLSGSGGSGFGSQQFCCFKDSDDPEPA